MTYDSLVNRGDYFSAHYLAEVLPKDLKSGLLAQWKQREADAAERAAESRSESTADAERPDDALPVTPRAGLRALRRPYFRARSYFALGEERELADDDTAGVHDDSVTYDSPPWREAVRALNANVLRALGFDAKPGTLTVERADQAHEVRVAHREKGLIALDCGWSPEPDDALDPAGAGRLLEPLRLDGQHTVATGAKLASFLFACEDAPRYVLLLVGGVVVLADRATWGEGRYLAVSLDTALERHDTKAGGELDTVAALFGADSLRTPEEGGENPLAELVDKSSKHAVGVSGELRDGLKESVELIANEVLQRMRDAGVRPGDVRELPELGRELTREALRYLYRILFLLYAETRPELGILPSDYPEYQQGYGLGRLGELVAERDLVDEKSRNGYYLYESLDLLFRKVQVGYRSRRTHGAEAQTGLDGRLSEGEGLRFEPLHSKLFEPESIRLIGKRTVRDPRVDADDDNETVDGGEERFVDTRLRNATLYRVLRKLMLTKGKKRERGGFISYAQLGINQLGAVYEGLMSYTGFVAGEELYEVAKNGDAKDGSWLVPATKAGEYPDEVFVRERDEDTGEERRVRYAPGAFVYRLSGRDRQTSASYYTPESLTRVTVQLALQHRLDQDDTVTPARELLDWKICEPALGSGAFLNEAINQVAAEYLRRRQDELGLAVDTEKYAIEYQKAKAYIALHNSYGVDLNSTAVELAEVSLWLNTMHPGMEAPWFGLHLRRGNSLIGGRREIYPAEKLKKKAWLGTTPERFTLADAVGGATLPEGAVHHFLLPAKEWGAVAGEKEAKALAPEAAKALGAWRRALTKSPTTTQTKRLQGLARRAEYLWGLVVQRLEISERDISRRIDVWGAEDGWLRSPEVAVQRDDVLADLEGADSPYWRLKKLMDAWCALWFWPVQDAGLLDGTDERYAREAQVASVAQEFDASDVVRSYEKQDLFGGVETVEVTQADIAKRRARAGKDRTRKERRPVIPLADLDDWLDFAESLLGTHDVPADSLITQFATLAELTPYEDALPDLMGMDSAHRLESRYPWSGVVNDIAERQGFFHWELEFAQIFASGGYDLQVGNPPWVRPRWLENEIFAELDPWFMLADKPNVAEWRLRKQESLSEWHAHNYFLNELATNVGIGAVLSDAVTYPLLVGTQPDLYRAFMCRVWKHSKATGMTGLIHPDSHFNGALEGSLRGDAYRHLRFHAHFINKRDIFPDIDRNAQFGVHIYGRAVSISFTHMSWLYDPATIVGSLNHDGGGAPPGVKHEGAWDMRPHAGRLIQVNAERLKEWNRLAGESQTSDREAPLLYPITDNEQAAISTLSLVSNRLGSYGPQISAGYHEKTGKEEGLITWNTTDTLALTDLILQGPHFIGATPFNKQPNNPCKTNRDWAPFDLTTLPADAAPRTNYVRACTEARYQSAQDLWDGHPYTSYYRLAWREMVPPANERSLFATLIPPGPAHIHAVRSMTVRDNQTTVLNGGFWAALPLDYLLRITGRGHLDVSEARKMPTARAGHPLTHALLLRTLRLNTLTDAYAPLWEELYNPTWPAYEDWANREWPNLRPLASHLTPNWEYETPLRTEHERRAALVELDSLVSVWLGITADQLVAIYRSRYPVLSDYESVTYFDANGRKIAGNHNTYGYGQTKQDYVDLLVHLENPDTAQPPEGYTAPFYKADREAEMRAAHAHFKARLDKEIAAGRWVPPERQMV
ncbi:class I SAM-dependent DNA methyltransferase [Streptomyces sp. N2-109]|uniref:site-specific DNA-methyltransferase (adenine-specific) n=1 Tax=Streptomyces gossypii TaxID=2883101 RepID=A0ABT2JSK2_9ACTN|nr:class I SAM-dependent DNA methyltransferase [Streptomyces gossypii]MCT2590741.1 class I SAM-dependent DNA methyltransferase [Streptomyces gossypii]